MIRLEDGRGGLFQWDLDQRLVIGCPDAEEVHYASPDGTALVTKVYERDWQRVSDIPNICLQKAGMLQVWICTADATLHQFDFCVTARQKPADYVYTETEVLRWEDLDTRLKALETAPGPDWGQNDPDAPGYIKNRTHWVEYEQAEILPVQNISLDTNPYMTQGTLPLVLGQTYTVSWDGREYTCVCGAGSLEGYSTIGIGNAAIYGGGEDTGEPFCIGVVPDLGAWGVFGTDGGSHSLGITGSVEVVHKIPEKFLPAGGIFMIPLTEENDGTNQYATSVTPAQVAEAISSGKMLCAVLTVGGAYPYTDYWLITHAAGLPPGALYGIHVGDTMLASGIFLSAKDEGGGYLGYTHGISVDFSGDTIYWIEAIPGDDIAMDGFSSTATPEKVIAGMHQKQIWARTTIDGVTYEMPLAAHTDDYLRLKFLFPAAANTFLTFFATTAESRYIPLLETIT